MTTVSVPVLIFDGECGFCTISARWLDRWVVRNGSTLVAPWQQLGLDELGLSEDECRTSVQWVGEDRGTASGHAAIAAALRDGYLVWRPIGALLVASGVSWLADRVYSWVARHRYALPGGTPACRVDDPRP